MARNRHNFKLADTQRLIRATIGAGQRVQAVEHDPKTGFVRVIVHDDVAKPATGTGNSWDDVNDDPART
jgi:hypothetical protein